ncbi:hypothetical protein TBLA_0E04830 [Henningerozyma blattae CBS 6284]|uniref:Importin N-terminal domain-containing protein n=1 Tax=Henningerozyma blattae (strain ATCC 34711 / CBS 6284 / DSM 70876 / NBRC 10599 / NRRL Y-10934 / UCD 77-7) TaxID=1071380 RepID=I2H583_HENB6|nr:hypothetical protein TBLA_0E04830 [Tetrapisispora blattae CBS 6284]CCH61535.1 hypothetical protein TBLA_0E04830 [Tetrapisispora blattae CBS 6284]
MDPNNLLQCFHATLSQDKSIRTNAEQQLKQYNKTPGFLGACLDIISSDQISADIKLSASLYFKNKITYGWPENSNNHTKNDLLDYAIDNDEKPIIREMLIQTLLKVSNSSTESHTSTSLLRILKTPLMIIISIDYSNKKWNDLLQFSLNLISNTNESDPQTINNAYIGLICLSEIFRTYRWTDNDARQDLEILILDYFPSLLNFANDFLLNDGKNLNNYQYGDMLKLIIKIYKFVTYIDLPFSLQKQESFINWANFFVKIIQLPLSNEILSISDVELRSKNSWCKCKKWSYANLFRLFQRYSTDSLTKKFEYNEFKDLYRSQFLPNLLKILFSQIENYNPNITNTTNWLSDESIYYIVSFIDQSIIDKKIWPLIKPNYNNIIQFIVFPILIPNESTLTTFEIDPQEYVHRNLELWDNDYSPDLATINLLTTAVTKRSKSTLEPTLQFIIEILKQNITPNGSLPLENAIKIESVLRMFSCIIDRLTNPKSPYYNQMEEFLKSFILPFFDSNYGFLKTRTCDIISKIGMLEFKDTSIIQIIYQGILKCLTSQGDDECLPAKLMSSLALQTFLQDVQFQSYLEPNVVDIMQILLNISNEFESDTISGVIQDFVEQFSKQLQPFGIDLMNNLVQQFLKLANELNDASNIDINNFVGSTEDLPDESDKQMAALGILSTTISILLSFENSPDIVKNLEIAFYPAAEFIMKNGIEDFYREVCEFFENSTFLLRTVSPVAWNFLQLINESLSSSDPNNTNDSSPTDSMIAFYLEDFMLIINNYLLYGQNELKTMQDYSNIIFKLYYVCSMTNINEDSTLDDLNILFDLSTKISFTLNDIIPCDLKEKILTDSINSIISEKDNLKKNVIFGVNSFNVIITNLISSPLQTLQFLSKKNVNNINFMELFFETWFTFYIPNYKRVFDIKLSLLALMSVIVNLSIGDIKTLSLDNVFLQILNVIIKLFENLPLAMQNLERQRKEFSLDDADFNTRFDDYEDEDEDDLKEDEADNLVIQNYLKELQEGTNGAGSEDSIKFVDGDLFNDNEDFEDLEEDPLSGSILDNTNVFEVFKQSNLQLQQSDNEKYQSILSTLTPENQPIFTRIMNNV